VQCVTEAFGKQSMMKNDDCSTPAIHSAMFP
jgi:hypothetical protein